MFCKFLEGLVLCLVLETAFVWGISIIEVSPVLTQTTWATDYVGALYTVTFTPSTTALDFTWSVSNGIALDFLTLTSADCATSSTTSGLLSLYTATCNGAQTTLSANQPITLALTITLMATVTSSTGISATLNMQVNPTQCQFQQSFSNAISQSSTPCNYNCTATFQCIPGYSTAAGPFYFSRCTSFATLDTGELCTVQSSVETSSASGIPVWGIILIALAGLAILAACIFFLWKFCGKKTHISTS